MDAFESLVAMLLRHEGYWVTTSFKVELTKSEKRRIGTATMPRVELDLVAYRGATNEVLVVECKSFLDSPGVRFRGFGLSSDRYTKRYKLFNSAKTRRIVFHCLEKQLVARQACPQKPTIRLALAAGKIVSDSDRIALHKLFLKKGWVLFDPDWLREKLHASAKKGYENDIALVVSKLLLRKNMSSPEVGGSVAILKERIAAAHAGEIGIPAHKVLAQVKKRLAFSASR